VTQALAKLERHVGVPLLKRHASGSYLNDYGRIFYRRAGNFVRSVEAAVAELGVPGGARAAPMFAQRLSRAKVRNLLIGISSTSGLAGHVSGSPASVVRTLHELERDLECSLFHRTSDGLVATQAGAQFGRTLRLSMQEIEWGIAEIDAARGSFDGCISIGALPSGGSVLLSSVLDEFLTKYPQVEVKIINENAEAMVRSLLDGRVDFVVGLLSQSPPAGLVMEPLARTPYVMAGRRGHELSLRKGITLKTLAEFEWIIGLQGSCRRLCFETLFAHGARPRAPIISSTLSVTRQLLEQSNRLTLMTSYEFQHETDSLSLIPYPLLSPVPTLGIAMRENWSRTSLHDSLIAILRRRMSAVSNLVPVERLAS
jgi:DNA-binding transcriptional LysR family regulator